MKTGLEKPHPQAADFVDRARAMKAVEDAARQAWGRGFLIGSFAGMALFAFISLVMP